MNLLPNKIVLQSDQLQKLIQKTWYGDVKTAKA